jgi:hypothetical protein
LKPFKIFASIFGTSLHAELQHARGLTPVFSVEETIILLGEPFRAFWEHKSKGISKDFDEWIAIAKDRSKWRQLTHSIPKPPDA